jgi:uncharacterized protein
MTTEAIAPVQSSEETRTEAAPQSLPALSLNERRVLGVLAEKAKTTPDTYPLTLNALVTGCNQKNNREPVLNLATADVEAAIAELKQKGLVQQIMGGGRVDKFKHTLYETLRVDKVQLAILTELLLRGPQTEGELRGRASRLEPIADLETLRTQLRQLAERGLAVFLGPEGRRGTTVTHGFHPPEDLERLRAGVRPGREAAPGAVASGRADLLQRLENLEREMAEVKSQLQELRSSLGGHGNPDRGNGANS